MYMLQDLFSYNVEQSRHDTFNLVPVIMHEKGFSLQEAVNFIGDLCKKTIDRFENDRQRVRGALSSIAKYSSTLMGCRIGL